MANRVLMLASLVAVLISVTFVAECRPAAEDELVDEVQSTENHRTRNLSGAELLAKILKVRDERMKHNLPSFINAKNVFKDKKKPARIGISEDEMDLLEDPIDIELPDLPTEVIDINWVFNRLIDGPNSVFGRGYDGQRFENREKRRVSCEGTSYYISVPHFCDGVKDIAALKKYHREILNRLG